MRKIPKITIFQKSSFKQRCWDLFYFLLTLVGYYGLMVTTSFIGIVWWMAWIFVTSLMFLISLVKPLSVHLFIMLQFGSLIFLIIKLLLWYTHLLDFIPWL